MKNMKSILLFLTCVITLNATSLAQNPGLTNDLNAKFRKYNVVKLDSRAELANVKAGRGLILPVNGRQLALLVIENDLRSANYRLVFKTATGDMEVPRPANTTYKGRVVGDSFSTVRLALDGEKVEGMIITGSNEYYIEPAKAYSLMAADNDFIIYDSKDVINKKEITCPLISRIERGMQMVNAKFSDDQLFTNTFAKNSAQTFKRSLSPGNLILNLSTDADLEYIKIFGGKATQYARIQAISNINETLNVVEGLYETSVNVTFNIPYQGGWLVQDPYNGCADPYCVIAKFKDYWNANRPPATFDGRNAAMLFTGKSVVNTNLGYTSVICNAPDYAYTMLVGNFSAQGYGNYRYAAAAHELSHNFGANHIEGQNLIDNPDCYNSIQGPSDPNRPFYGALRMCQFTVNEMTTHMQQNSCLLIQ